MFLFLPFVDCSIKASKSFNVLKRLRIIIVPIPLHSVSVEAEIPITEQLQEPPGQRKPQDKISNQVFSERSQLFVCVVRVLLSVVVVSNTDQRVTFEKCLSPSSPPFIFSLVFTSVVVDVAMSQSESFKGC